MISVVSYTIPIDAAEVILIWPHEFAENMQTNEVVLFIAYIMSLGLVLFRFFQCDY